MHSQHIERFLDKNVQETPQGKGLKLNLGDIIFYDNGKIEFTGTLMGGSSQIGSEEFTAQVPTHFMMLWAQFCRRMDQRKKVKAA